MSKDGDWIVRETPEALDHVRGVLARHGARYRFGAPLDVRWMRGGWSSHFEFQADGLRIRTDFITRPAQLVWEDVELLFGEQSSAPIPVTDARRLAALKMTDREKDYAVIGELARHIDDPFARLVFGRGPEDLVEWARESPALVRSTLMTRPLLSHAIAGDSAALAAALDAERRQLMQTYASRIAFRAAMAARWAAEWPALDRELESLPLPLAHERMVERALGVLPFAPESW
jgi:hypothetical protein